MVVIPDTGHITFVLEVESYEIFHELGTTGEVDIGVVREGVVLEHLFLPVNVRITFCLAVVTEVITVLVIVGDDGMILVAEKIDKRLWTIVSPRTGTANGELVLNGLVAEHVAVVRVVLAGKL